MSSYSVFMFIEFMIPTYIILNCCSTGCLPADAFSESTDGSAGRCRLEEKKVKRK